MTVFLVESDLPEMTPEFIAMIPAHRQVVNRLFAEGHLLMYAVSEERDKWWCTVKAETEMEVMDILSEMPLLKYLNPVIHPLMFFNGAEQMLPAIYLN